MNHESFLSDLVTSLPEINGAFLFAPMAGILASHTGIATSNFNPQTIGEKMTSIADKASDHIHDITHLQVNFDDLILSGRLLPNQNWLFLLHAPELSGGMIRMALQMALNNSIQEDDSPATPPEPPVEKIIVEEPVAKEKIQVDIEALMAPGAPLARHLNILQEGLATCIGPAALPVFQEVLTAWCQDNSPTIDTLKQLIPLLDKEIDDPEDIATFHTHIKDLFPQE